MEKNKNLNDEMTTEVITKTPKNKKVIIVMVSILAILSLVFIGIKAFKKETLIIIYPDDLTFEIGEDLYKELSTNKENAVITTKIVDNDKKGIKDIKLNTSYTLEVSVDGEVKEYKEGIKFKDTKAPIIEIKNKDIVLENGKELIIEASATDNYDKEVKVVINDKDIDTTKAGEYLVEVSAKDTSGNEAKEVVKVTVKEEEKEVATTTSVKTNTTTKSNSGNSTNTNQGSVAGSTTPTKSQAQIDCEANWGKWTTNGCSWDQNESTGETGSTGSENSGSTDGKDDGCSVSAKLAEYEAYAKQYNDDRGGGYAWSYSYQPDNGFLELYVHAGDGRGIPETRQVYYCKQP